MRQAWTDDRMDDLVQRVDAGFAAVDQQFARVDQRFQQVDQRFEKVDERFAQVDRRLERIDDRFEQQRIETRELFGEMNKRIDRIWLAFLTGSLGIIAALIAS